MRFPENHAADATTTRWLARPTLKSRPSHGDVVHHNTLNAASPSFSSTDEERSREVERFFDIMTTARAPEASRNAR